MKTGFATTGLLFGLGVIADSTASPRVVHMPFNQQRSSGIPPHLKTKRDTVNVNLGNARSFYYANVSIGTPPQQVGFQLDTGSADVWMLSSNASICSQIFDGFSPCQLGSFDISGSSSARVVDQDGFRIQYVDGSGSRGSYFTDNIRLGDIEIQDQQMGLAETSELPQGIIGLSFPEAESICAQREGPCNSYPTLLQQMVSQGRINSQAYSLWLNDLGADEGSILFGGIDTAKYVGDLVQLPVQRDAISNSYTSFTVAWTGFSMTTPDGPVNEDFVPSGGLSAPAIFDSGTTIMLLPSDMTQKIYDQVGAFVSQEIGVAVAPCYFSDTNITLDFQFGGSNGPTISVLLGEFLLDLGTDQFGDPVTFENGDTACQFGIMGGGSQDPILFGDTFLRSAYVVYDLDNRSISLAQTRFNATASHIVEISRDGGVPNVSSTASAVSASQTATGLPVPGGGSNTGTDDGSDSDNQIGMESEPPLARYTTAAPPSPSDQLSSRSVSAGSGGPTATASSGSPNGGTDTTAQDAQGSQGAAASLRLTSLTASGIWGIVSTIGIACLGVVVGSGLLVL